MASIKKRPDGKWRARHRDPSGKELARHFERRVDAERWITSTEHSKLTGAYVDPAAGKVTLRDYAERWRAAQVHRPSTAVQVEGNLRTHVYPTFGERPLVSIRPSEVQAWVRGLTDVLAPGTVELVYRYLASILRAAVADRLIVRTPCEGVKLPKKHRAQVAPLPVEGVEALVDAMPGRYRAMVVLAAGTGLRQGECFGLTVDRVDFLRRSLMVDRQLSLVSGDVPKLAPPKTEASIRRVPLPTVVVDALARHLADFRPGEDGLVFTSQRGEPIRRPRFSEDWRPAVARAGLPVGTRFHDLRHFYASLLIRHGESVKVVQARLGHASAAETLDTYSHLWPDSEDQTRAAVDSVLGAAADSPRTAADR